MEGNPPVSGTQGQPPAKRRKYALRNAVPSLGTLTLTTCRFNYDLTKTIDVVVGKEPNQRRFTVYHDILTRRSEFFRAARSGRWIAQPEQATLLDDHEPDVFSVYLHCVSFGRKELEEHIDALPVAEETDNQDCDSDSSGELKREEESKESTQANNENGAIEETQSIGPESEAREDSDDIDRYIWEIGDNGFQDKFFLDLCLLADKLLDPVTANMAVSKLIRLSEVRYEYPSPALISYVYKTTMVGSPLRRLLRDWYVFTVSESWVDTIHHDGYPHAFLRDLLHEI